MQLRLQPTLTLEQYVTQRAWEKASLPFCPLHPAGGCGYRRHTVYWRKVPEPVPIARFYCAEGHVTFSLLPDFFSSRLPGTLDDVERAAVAVEKKSLEQAAEELRPGEAVGAVTLESAKRWTNRRVALFATVLVAVVGLLPDRFANVRTPTELRRRMGTTPALVALRGIAASWLRSLPPPLGFGPRTRPRAQRDRTLQHDSGPDPPERIR